MVIKSVCLLSDLRKEDLIKKKLTAYATSAQIRQIRKKIFEIVKRESADTDLRNLFKKLILETISTRIEAETTGIYPLHNVYVHKLKILNKPPFDRFKLADLHNEKPEDFGSIVKKTEETDFQTGGEMEPEQDVTQLGGKIHAYSEAVTDQQ